MKNHASTHSRILPFLIYHGILIIAALLVFFIRPPHLSTSFLEIIPSGGSSKSLSNAEEAFTAKQNAHVNFIISSADFSRAKTVAEEFYASAEETGFFTSLSLKSGNTNTEEIDTLLKTHYPSLLDEETQEAIRKDPAAYQADSLARIFGAFTLSSLSNLSQDPFLLEEGVYQDYLGKLAHATTLAPKEGVLATQSGGKWYILLTASLNAESLSLNSNNIKRIFALGDALVKANPDVQINYSGIPFHSWESASSSKKEITLISTLSIVAILALFLILCHNIHIVLIFLISITLSLLSAIAALVIAVRDVHIITLIFGTTLIGTAIDYAIHFSLRYAQKNPEASGSDVARDLKKSLTVGFLSTELCYALLVISPYSILRQVAIFSIFGMLSSYITALYLFPYLFTSRTIPPRSFLTRPVTRIPSVRFLPLLAIISTLLFFLSLPHLQIKNDLTKLYTMSPRMLEGEKTAGTVLGYMATTYAIVEGDSEADALEKEALFTKKLDALQDEGSLESYLAITSFLPAPSEQRASQEAVRALLPYLDEQIDLLSLSEEEGKTCRRLLSSDAPTLGIKDLGADLSAALSQLAIGTIGNHYYTAIICQNVTNAKEIRDAIGNESIGYFQKSNDIATQLDTLTVLIFRLFAIALALMLVLLILSYGLSKGLHLMLAPYTIVTGTIAIAPFISLELDFFFAIAMVLVIGLGLDYIVFANEKKNIHSIKAVTLSFLTTELSFGTLLFSSFRPVHIFGLTVFSGILIAYLSAMGSLGSRSLLEIRRRGQRKESVQDNIVQDQRKDDKD